LDAADPVEESPLPRALLEPECYDHPTTAIRLVETHISWVLLTGPYAYKIKKPLRLPFLDFASMAARRHFCEEELRVNRRLAPDLYLDVVPITGSPSQPRVAGAGRAFEHAVRMVQFDERERLDLMAERGELEEDRIREAARLVARFHAAAAAAGIDDGFATPARIRTESLENLDALDAATGHDAPTLARLRAWTEHSLEALAEAFSERHATGRVRECHGDLHLANMALWRGAVLAFDAIEFDERLRWIDVMSEVAFTLMDLHHRRREGLAFAFLDEYLQGSGDHAGLAVLRHYLVYRALVRAKIDAIRADATGGDARREAMVEEHSQIALAARFAFEAPPPLMILTHGVSGSGKSHLAARLLAALGAVRLRSDVERARLHPQARTRYGAAATARTYAHLARAAGRVVAAGWPVIVDATFLEPQARALVREEAARRGVPVAILACGADPDTLRTRVSSRARAGDDASEATSEVLEAQLAAYRPLSAPELECTVSVDTGAAIDVPSVAAALRRRAGAQQRRG
jgi:aminoglycoside phosphotransferase family enzyme/predicted kinase